MLAYQALNKGTLTTVDPTIFKAKMGIDPNEPSLIEALSSPHSEQWTKAMTEEVINIVKRQTWDVIRTSEAPEGSNIIPGTCAFKWKSFHDGSFIKFKAQFCVRGDIHKMLSDVPMNTYDTVVRWYKVRLMMFLTCIMELKTQATDFRNAFAQSKLKKPV